MRLMLECQTKSKDHKCNNLRLYSFSKYIGHILRWLKYRVITKFWTADLSSNAVNPDVSYVCGVLSSW